MTVGEGPSMDARQADDPVLISDLATSASRTRWPLFTPLALESGVRAVFAWPLSVGVIRLGVLALHQVHAGSLGENAMAESAAFADLAIELLLDQQAGIPADAVLDCGPPLRSPQVHQATGMIAAQLGVPMSEAFIRLRARAFADHRPLTELAGHVVARHLRFDLAGD
ncbi:ANTAR domain-containing protein [Pseudonocardiaceae bacterium YIM PH 21723]|nr:ANTAR domain-containing protein [Pseudonocardiaceae bacterium YIM PH 21723]